jgi:protein-S-isoprenylcysteine O-methyltransferase Ste14
MTSDNTRTHPSIRLRYFLPYLLIFIFVPILTYFIGTTIDALFFLPPFPPFPFNIVLGLGILLSGAAVGIKATRQLRRAGKGLPWGAFAKDAQATTLVTTGIYAHIRNPITFGYTLLPLGMGLIFRSLGMAVPISLTVLVIMVIRIKRIEEPQLTAQFGEEYLEYKRTTPFMVPRVIPLVMGLFTRQRKDTEATDSSTS